MSHIDQMRSFEERLSDFGPELGDFLSKVWRQRDSIDVEDFDVGEPFIYGLYAGSDEHKKFCSPELKRFINELRRVGSGYEITVQTKKKGVPRRLGDYGEPQITVFRQVLWRTFFHVIYRRGGGSTAARAYVHATDWRPSLAIMDLIISQFGRNQGLWEVKTAGPGQRRLDTIVAYFHDRDSRDEIVQLLIQAQQRNPSWFANSLPPLVKREAVGIGSADNPPKVEITDEGKTGHSFGSFYATIIWVALATIPDENVDPRHLLDNVLYCLRLLGVDPAKPQVFPARERLEAWYREHEAWFK